MNKTFADMKSNVGLELQDTTTPFNTLIGKWLNRRYFQALRTINWDAINSDYTISVVSGTQDYVLPRDFKSAVYVIDSANNITYNEVRFDGYADSPRTITSQGGGHSYTIFEAPVYTQPTAGSVVTIVSSSTSDIATSVTIRGDVAGAETSETLTLNGTSTVTGSKVFTRIKSISKDVTVGAVTVTCNSQTMCVIDAEQKVVRVMKIRIFSVPNANTTLSIPYHIKPLPMVLDNDIPVIDIDDCLEAGARADGWRYKRQGNKAGVEEGNFNLMLSDYQWNLENQPNRANQFQPVSYPRD